jgi:hypothetical protein
MGGDGSDSRLGGDLIVNVHYLVAVVNHDASAAKRARALMSPRSMEWRTGFARGRSRRITVMRAKR